MKSILKLLKLNESTISMALGLIILIAIGVLVVNYVQTKNEIERQIAQTEPTSSTKEYVVQNGDTLWKIAENFYNDGYKWIDIQEENNLTNPGQIEVGQTLIIPEATTASNPTPSQNPELAKATAIPSQTPITTQSPTTTPSSTPSPSPSQSPILATTAPSPTPEMPTNRDLEKYTVEKGDSLWKIAAKIYNDGYKWPEIAKLNNLSNPSIIHTGNVLALPSK